MCVCVCVCVCVYVCIYIYIMQHVGVFAYKVLWKRNNAVPCIVDLHVAVKNKELFIVVMKTHTCFPLTMLSSYKLYRPAVNNINVSIFSSDFKRIWIFLIDFNKSIFILNSTKIRPVGTELIRVDRHRRTDLHGAKRHFTRLCEVV